MSRLISHFKLSITTQCIYSKAENYVHRQGVFSKAVAISIAIPPVALMEALPAFQTRVLPEVFPYLGLVSLSLTVAPIARKAVPYKSDELERCHSLAYVVECTLVRRVETIWYCSRVVRRSASKVLDAKTCTPRLISDDGPSGNPPRQCA